MSSSYIAGSCAFIIQHQFTYVYYTHTHTIHTPTGTYIHTLLHRSTHMAAHQETSCQLCQFCSIHKSIFAEQLHLKGPYLDTINKGNVQNFRAYHQLLILLHVAHCPSLSSFHDTLSYVNYASLGNKSTNFPHQAFASITGKFFTEQNVSYTGSTHNRIHIQAVLTILFIYRLSILFCDKLSLSNSLDTLALSSVTSCPYRIPLTLLLYLLWQVVFIEFPWHSCSIFCDKLSLSNSLDTLALSSVTSCPYRIPLTLLLYLLWQAVLIEFPWHSCSIFCINLS